MKYRSLIFFLIIIPLIFSACSGMDSDSHNLNDDSLPKQPVMKDTSIYVVFAAYNNTDTTLVNLVMKNTENFFNVKCLPFVRLTLPADAYNAEWARYSADSLLQQLKKNKPVKADYIQGLTDQDIFTPTEKHPYWGIFGLGSFVNPTSVVSTFRLHAGNCTEEKFEERLIKVALHELGHNFGLEHCPTLNCMMEDARGTIVTVDNEKIEVCNDCKKKVQLKFNSLKHD